MREGRGKAELQQHLVSVAVDGKRVGVFGGEEVALGKRNRGRL
jgi:hypothetical protein